MAEVHNQSSLTALSSPPTANSADRLVPAPRDGRVITNGCGGTCGGGGGSSSTGEANSGYTDCDARHVVNLSEYNVCVQMGGHASIAQQSQGEREKSVYGARPEGRTHTCTYIMHT